MVTLIANIDGHEIVGKNPNDRLFTKNC